MKYVAYEKYKSSGTEWLGNVPAHWEVSPLKYAASIKTGYAFSSDEFTDEGIPVLRISDITKEGMVDLSNAKYLPIENAIAFGAVTLKKDDIVMAMTGATIGKAGRYESNNPCLLNQRVCAFKTTKDNHQTFLWYLLNADFFNKHIALTAFGGAQPNISDTQLLACDAPLPPLEEQQTIARFLDTKTAQIDELITKKCQLIDKLKEKRQALIARTVTRGLPPKAAKAAGLEPNPEMKNANEVWMGEVPSHWSVKPLKFLAEIQTGFAFSSDDFTDEGIPVVRIGDISREGEVDLSDTKYLPAEYSDSHASVSVRNGDILMAMTGATIGKAARYKLDSPALLNQRVCAFRSQTGYHQGYLWFILNSDFYIRYVLLIAFGGAQPNISDKQLLDCGVPVPPPKEQEEIFSFLEIETRKLENLIIQANVAIDRLTEYRQALITSAVTGKIDVRGLA